MPGQGTTKYENHPHPALPRRGGGNTAGASRRLDGKEKGHFHINGHARMGTTKDEKHPDPSLPRQGGVTATILSSSRGKSKVKRHLNSKKR